MVCGQLIDAPFQRSLNDFHCLEIGQRLGYDGRTQSKSGKLFIETIYTDADSLNKHFTTVIPPSKIARTFELYLL